MSKIKEGRKRLKPVLAPAADRYATDPATATLDMQKAHAARFILNQGAGGVGTVKLTAESCDAADGGGVNTEIEFQYRVTDIDGVVGALTAVTVPATGYTTVAGANKIVEVFVSEDDMVDGDQWVRIQLTEVANDPCVAGLVGEVGPLRYSP